MKTILVGAVLLLWIKFALAGSILAPRNSISIEVVNDTDGDLYDPQVISDKGRYLILRGEAYRIRPQATVNAHGHILRSIPKHLIVRWKEKSRTDLIEKKIDIRSVLGLTFSGYIFINILDDDSLELSWTKIDAESGVMGCGGYIFEKYSYRAESAIRKNIDEWKTRKSELEAAKKEGRMISEEVEDYYARISENTFRCNHFLYLKRGG